MSYSGTFGGTYDGSWGGAELAAPLTPNAFDTGLGRPQRTLIRDAVAGLLARLHVANGGYLAAIVPTSTVVAGGHDQDGVDLLFDLLQGQAPAVAVAVGDALLDPAGDTFGWTATIDVHVYVLVNSLRSKLSRVAGDVVSLGNENADPGCDVILEHCQQLLIGQKPGGLNGKIKELRPRKEELMGTDGGNVELWHQLYTVVATRSIDPKRDLDVELRLIRTYHQLADQTGIPTVVTTDTEV